MGKGNLSTDIQKPASILHKGKICSDISPLQKIIDEVKDGGYDLQKLKFTVDAVPNNTRPNVTSLEILLNIQINL